MANLDAPNGFVPVRHRSGGLVRYSGGFTIESALASDIFLGDAVIMHATPAGDGNNIDVSGTGGSVLGIFAGCQYTAANGDVVWAKQWVSGTVTLGSVSAEAFVYTDLNIVFSVQLQGAYVAADVHQFADLVAGAGNVATGISGFELATPAAGTAKFQVLGLSLAPDGIFPADASSVDPRVEVVISESALIASPLASI
jgi:hypothetical protein